MTTTITINDDCRPISLDIFVESCSNQFTNTKQSKNNHILTVNNCNCMGLYKLVGITDVPLHSSNLSRSTLAKAPLMYLFYRYPLFYERLRLSPPFLSQQSKSNLSNPRKYVCT